MPEKFKMGYLEIIMGPMWAGKTSKLIQYYNYYLKQHQNVLVINYSEDTRYTTKNYLFSHDKLQIPCKKTKILAHISDIEQNKQSETFKNCHVILINECQFFPDIVPWVKIAIEKYNKIIHICGLDCDFKREPFGNWLDLIRHADSVSKLVSKCNKCNCRNAIYSHRLSDSKKQILVGVNEYEPLCRRCYLSMVI